MSFNVRGHAGGGDISGFSVQDLMVLGLLRAIADAVIVGAGTLRVDSAHVWTAASALPELADEYCELRSSLGKPRQPLNVIVSGSGDIDVRAAVFASGKVPALVVTTVAGARRLRKQLPAPVEIAAVRNAGARPIAPGDIIGAVCRGAAATLILVEGGPRLLGHFYASRMLDEQFLTLAPQVAGRVTHDRRLSLVMGKIFGPQSPLWGDLTDVRRGGGHLFLRYSFMQQERRAPRKHAPRLPHK